MGARFYKCPDCRKSNFNINQLHDISHSKSGYISSSTQRSSGVLITAHFVSESQTLLLEVCLFSFFNKTFKLTLLFCSSIKKHVLTMKLVSTYL